MTNLQTQRALALIALLAAGHGHHIDHSTFVQSAMVIVPAAVLGLTHLLIVRGKSPDRHKPHSWSYPLAQEPVAALA